MNTNAVHNALNLAITVVSSAAIFDFTSLGLSQTTALKIIAGLGLAKLIMNAVRDGIAGMVKPQPPVKA